MFRNQQGSAAFITLAMVLLLAALSAAFITLTTTNSTIAAEFQNGAAAQYAAEAGAQNVLAMFASSSPDWQIFGTAEKPVNMALLNFPRAFYQARIALKPTQPLPPETEYQVTIIGSCRQARRVINFTVAVNTETNTQLVSNWFYVENN
ncbi:MAG: hypothetical protein LBR56_00360 [Sporomusaceae bacterium]|jgi:hypothetical protein|nr:hypothetical protein [Sporomusaceae bacterium]